MKVLIHHIDTKAALAKARHSSSSRRKYFHFQPVIVPVLFLALLSLTTSTRLWAADTVTLAFESQGLDLDTGAVVELSPMALPGDGEADIKIAYHADTTPHARLVATGGAELASLGTTPFVDVSAADIGGASFSSTLNDTAFGANQTALVRTASGAVFKLGNASETAEGVSFDAVRLQ